MVSTESKIVKYTALIGIYVYAVTILSQYGYLSHFKIPSDYVKASIEGNTIFFFSVIRILLSVASSIHWYQWLFLGFGIIGGLLIVLLVIERARFLLLPLKITIVIATLFFFFNTANYLASLQREFLVVSTSCAAKDPSFDPQKSYAQLSLYDSKSILVVIDKDNQIEKGFLTEDLSQMPCSLEYKTLPVAPSFKP